MTCQFDTSKIQDYLENLLSPEERQEVEAHLATCPQCHREWVEMSNLLELLGGLPMEELPEGFKEELHEKLMTTVQEKPLEKKATALKPLMHIKKHIKAYSAAAAVLVVGMVSFSALNMGKLASPQEVYDMAGAPPATMENRSDPALYAGGYEPAPEAPKVTITEADALEAQDGEKFKLSLESAQFGDAASADASGAGSLQDRKVIRSGSANLSTLHYDKTIEALTAYTIQAGGYVENLYTGNQYTPVADETALKTGSITLRVPAGKFDDFFKNLESYGKVAEKTLTSEDISNQYRDTYNQAVNLEVREAKLREIMGTAKTVQDVMAVEAELSRVRGEINQLKGTLQQWDALVSLSRITISITEVRSLETQVTGLDTSLLTRIREAFIASLNSVIAGAENLAVWAVSAVPWLIIGVVILLGLWFPMKKSGWIRRIKK